MDHDTMDHDTMDHDTMDHDTMDHDTMDPDTMDPDTMDPDTMDHDTMDPDPANKTSQASNSSKVAVVGLGNWGTALAQHLAAKGLDVVCWAREAQIVEGVNRDHRNPLFQNHVKLHPNLSASAELGCAAAADFVVLAFPSAGLGDLLPKLRIKPGAIIISAIKGLEMESHLTPLQFAASKLSPGTPLAVISGPSFAKEVILHKPCGLVAASADAQVALRVAELFSSDWMRLYTSTDPLGVELGGILKNVIALAVGVADGLEFGDSARAGLITRGLAEMMRLSQAMGADVRTLSGLSGLGDLAMTATSDTSRNRTVGLRLGRGENLEQIVANLGSVAEGVKTAYVVEVLAAQFGVEMPISAAVARLLRREAPMDQIVRSLLSRPVKSELN